MSLIKNLFKNGIANTIQKVVRVLQQLFLVPFFIKAWGASYYGEWLTLTIIPSILAFSDLGFGSAAANTFVLRYAGGNKQEAANMAKAGFRIISWIISIGILLSGLIVFILNFFNVFDNSVISAHDSIIAVLLMMGARLLGFYSQLYDGYFRSARQAAKSINLRNLYAVINIIGGLIVLELGGKVIAFALMTFVVSVIFYPLFIYFANRTLELTELKTAKVIKEDVQQAFKVGIGYLFSPMWQAVYFQGSTFIVRIVLGPAAVAVFNTVRTLARSANQIFNVIYSSVFPELQYEIGNGNMNKARQLFRISMLLIAFLAIVGALFLLFFGMWFYQIWTSHALNPPVGMWHFFILGIVFNALWWTAEMVFIAKNEPYRFTVPALILACLSVAASYFLTKQFGLDGAAAATLILELGLFIYALPAGSQMIGQKVLSFISDFLKMDISIFSIILKRKIIRK